MRNMTIKTATKHKPMMGKLTKYRNALRCQMGASRGSKRPVTGLSSKGPLYNGLGGSSSSGGVDNVPHRNDNSTEYLRHAFWFKRKTFSTKKYGKGNF